jgi:hypothetical protein
MEQVVDLVSSVVLMNAFQDEDEDESSAQHVLAAPLEVEARGSACPCTLFYFEARVIEDGISYADAHAYNHS